MCYKKIAPRAQRGTTGGYEAGGSGSEATSANSEWGAAVRMR